MTRMFSTLLDPLCNCYTLPLHYITITITYYQMVMLMLFLTHNDSHVFNTAWATLQLLHFTITLHYHYHHIMVMLIISNPQWLTGFQHCLIHSAIATPTQIITFTITLYYHYHHHIMVMFIISKLQWLAHFQPCSTASARISTDNTALYHCTAWSTLHYNFSKIQFNVLFHTAMHSQAKLFFTPTSSLYNTWMPLYTSVQYNYFTSCHIFST